MAELEIGQEAPPFELSDDGGRTIRLAEFHGKIVVLYFYPKDDTPACTAEAVDFSALAGKFRHAGATVVGVSPDAVKAHERFKRKHGIGVRLLSDPERRAIDAYGVWVEKTMYGRAFMGVERATFLIGRDGRIARVWRKVRVEGHAAEVLAAVKVL